MSYLTLFVVEAKSTDVARHLNEATLLAAPQLEGGKAFVRQIGKLCFVDYDGPEEWGRHESQMLGNDAGEEIAASLAQACAARAWCIDILATAGEAVSVCAVSAKGRLRWEESAGGDDDPSEFERPLARFRKESGLPKKIKIDPFLGEEPNLGKRPRPIKLVATPALRASRERAEQQARLELEVAKPSAEQLREQQRSRDEAAAQVQASRDATLTILASLGTPPAAKARKGKLGKTPKRRVIDPNGRALWSCAISGETVCFGGAGMFVLKNGKLASTPREKIVFGVWAGASGFLAADGGLHCSRDDGKSWEQLSVGSAANSIARHADAWWLAGQDGLYELNGRGLVRRVATPVRRLVASGGALFAIGADSYLLKANAPAALRGLDPYEMVNSALVLPSGVVLLFCAKATYRSTDGGTSFEKTQLPGLLAGAVIGGRGYVVGTLRQERELLALDADGTQLEPWYAGDSDIKGVMADESSLWAFQGNGAALQFTL